MKSLCDSLSRLSLAPACAALVVVAGCGGGAPVSADVLNLDDPDEVIRLNLRLHCNENEGEYSLFWWQGNMYSRVQGERDRVLFGVQGMNIGQCVSYRDPVRGLCYRSISRELMFYLDPQTGEVVREWENPWTGETLEVVHVANDPPGRGHVCARDENGNPTAVSRYFFKDGKLMHGGGAARLFYANPLGGDFQEYVGGTYHAMELGSSATPIERVLDDSIGYVNDRVISWGRVSQWLPWMAMGSREGWVFFHTAGMRLDSVDELPEVMQAEMRLNHPHYFEPPPMDYERPRETSWTVFRDHLERRRAERSGD